MLGRVCVHRCHPKDKMCPLKMEGAEDLVGHRESGEHARDPGQSSAGLGQNQHIGHRVADPGDHEDPEVEHSGGQVRSSQGIEQANHDEGNDVLQVILVASG